MYIQILLLGSLVMPNVVDSFIIQRCTSTFIGDHSMKQPIIRFGSNACDGTNNADQIRSKRMKSTNFFSSTSTGEETNNADEKSLPEPSSMRIREIKDELNSMGISFTDCFDKDSLTERLVDARSGKVTGGVATEEVFSDDSGKGEEAPKETSASAKTSTFDKEEFAEDLRPKKVRELRTMCASKNIRWANFIEKEELVQALVEYQLKASNFSPSGKIVPGKVSMIDDDTLDQELTPDAAATPLLLDVFAEWCGPCKMMAPFLDEAASELGDKVRVAKIDSDQYPEWAGKLQVKGLPTVVVFDGKTGKELERVEGALMKEQLVQLADRNSVV